VSLLTVVVHFEAQVLDAGLLEWIDQLRSIDRPDGNAAWLHGPLLFVPGENVEPHHSVEHIQPPALSTLATQSK